MTGPEDRTWCGQVFARVVVRTKEQARGPVHIQAVSTGCTFVAARCSL